MTRIRVRTLDAWPELRPQAVLSAVRGANVRAARRFDHDDLRLDLPDLRLTLSGVTLRRARLGDDDVWDIAVEPSPWWHPDCGTETRWWQEPVTGAAPSALRGAMRTAGVDDLVEVRRHTRRWTVERPVRSADGVEPGDQTVSGDLASVVLEHVTIGERPPIVTVRIGGERRLVDDLASAFRAAGAAERRSTKPVDSLAGRHGPPLVPLGPLPEEPTAGDVVRRAIAGSVARLLANDLAIRLQLGPEGVHQARVATRRLRSDLRTLAELVDPDWAEELASELKWLADALGAVRDADVLGERLERRLGQLEPDDAEQARAVVAHLEASRTVDAAALDEVMASDRYVVLLERLVGAARAPHLTEQAERPAREVLDAIAARAWRPLAKAARRAIRDGVDAPIEEIHAVRIKAKRFRYAADVAAAVEPAAGRHARRIATLQDELGELNDAATAERWLRRQLPGASEVRAFVIGQLVGYERAEIDRRRRTWVGAWRRVAKRRARRWLHAQ
jgi:CHAD domain-containing protein